MKTGITGLRYFITIALMILFYTACKTTGDTITTTISDSATQTVIASDELNVNYELDQAINEAIIATTVSPTASERITGNILTSTIAGAVIDTTKISEGIITIYYYNNNADNTKSRSGHVEIALPLDSGKVIPWGTKGAIAGITFTQYEVTVLKSNVSLWMNGSGTITNVSGGLLNNIIDSLIDKISAKVAYTYNDNSAIISTWTWNFNQLRTFNINDTIISMSIEGDTIVNSMNNISTSGITRSNQTFYTGITAPVLQNISSSSFLSYNPLSGVKVIHGITEPITITYGVNQQGNSVSGGNPFGYKIAWTNTAGQANQAVISY